MKCKHKTEDGKSAWLTLQDGVRSLVVEHWCIVCGTLRWRYWDEDRMSPPKRWRYRRPTCASRKTEAADKRGATVAQGAKRSGK